MTPDLTAKTTTKTTTAKRSFEMPSLASGASNRAQRAQHFLFRSVAVGLLLLIVAAIAGPFTWMPNRIDIAALIGLIAFLAAITLRTARLRHRPDKIWAESRLLAEDVKSAAWRYAVGGAPYGVLTLPAEGVETPPADGAQPPFTSEVYDLHKTAHAAGVHVPFLAEDPDYITVSMKELRRQPLQHRRAVYIEERITHQCQYYSAKALQCERLANRWDEALIGIEGAGVLLALAKVLGALEFDLLGVTAVLVAAGTSWTQLNQFTSRAQSYGAIEVELARSLNEAREEGKPWTEGEWARFVASVENLLAGEHLDWQRERRKEDVDHGPLS
jgi:hypothetical protein